MIKEVFEDFPVPELNCYWAWPSRFYEQERDWTCAFACIRTLLSTVIDTVPTEDSFIAGCKPGKYFSKKLVKLGSLRGTFVAMGGTRDNISLALNILNLGKPVMLLTESQGPHWIVLLGVYTTKKNPNHAKKYEALYYDPYCNKVTQINWDVLLSQWQDVGKHHFELMYIGDYNVAREVWCNA